MREEEDRARRAPGQSLKGGHVDDGDQPELTVDDLLGADDGGGGHTTPAAAAAAMPMQRPLSQHSQPLPSLLSHAGGQQLSAAPSSLRLTGPFSSLFSPVSSSSSSSAVAAQLRRSASAGRGAASVSQLLLGDVDAASSWAVGGHLRMASPLSRPSSSSPAFSSSSTSLPSPSRRSFGASLGLDIASAVSGGEAREGGGREAAGKAVEGARSRSVSPPTQSPSTSSADSPTSSSSPSSSPASAAANADGGYRSVVMTRRSRQSTVTAVAHNGTDDKAQREEKEEERPVTADTEKEVRVEERKEEEEAGRADVQASSPRQLGRVQAAEERKGTVASAALARSAAASVSETGGFSGASSVGSSPGESPKRLAAPTFHFAADGEDVEEGERDTSDEGETGQREKADVSAAAAVGAVQPLAAEDEEDEADAIERLKADTVRREAQKEEEARILREEKDKERQKEVEEERQRELAAQLQRDADAQRQRAQQQRRAAAEAAEQKQRKAEAEEKREKERLQEEQRQRREREQRLKQEEDEAKQRANAAKELHLQEEVEQRRTTAAAQLAAFTSPASPAKASAPRASTAATALPTPAPGSQEGAASSSSPRSFLPSAASAASAASSPSLSLPLPASVLLWKAAVRSDVELLVKLLVEQAHVHSFLLTSSQQRPARIAYLLSRALLHYEALTPATPSSPLASTAPSLSAFSASSSLASSLTFRSAFSPSSSSFSSSFASQQSLRFLPSAPRAKSVAASAMFPYPLPFASLSAAPHYSLPAAAESDDDADGERSPTGLTPLDRSFALSVALHSLTAAAHRAAAAADRSTLCLLFATLAHTRRLLQPSSSATSPTTASPVLERAYAIAFIPSTTLLPASPPPLSSFLFPASCELSVVQWFCLLLLDVHALLHQLLVLHLLEAWQASAPPVALIWQEDEGLTSPVLESYTRLYAELDGDCQLHGLSVQQRQSVLSVCLRSLSVQLFNSVVQQHNLTMDTGLRLKWVCSSLSDFAVRSVGDAFVPRLLPLLEAVQELAMVLLLDKQHAQLQELTAVAPHLSLLTIHHVVFVFLQSEGNEEDSVSPDLLRQLAQAMADKQQKDGQGAEQSGAQSPTLPTQTVLLLDLDAAKQLQPPLTHADMGAQGVQAMDRERQAREWEPPEAIEQHPRLRILVTPPTQG